MAANTDRKAGATGEAVRLRRFSATVATGLTLVAALSGYRGHLNVAVLLAGVAVVLALLGFTVPRVVRPMERAWMALAQVLGWVNTRLILGAMFYVAFVPIGLVLRAFRDPLDRKLGDGRPSVWVRRTPKPLDPKAYENQF